MAGTSGCIRSTMELERKVQLGVHDPVAVENARRAGIEVVVNRCPMIDARGFWPDGGGPFTRTDQKR